MYNGLQYGATEMRKKDLTLLLLLLILLSAVMPGCFSYRKRNSSAGVLKVPSGLDSTTTIRAYELAERNFVSTRREEDAQEYSDAGMQRLGSVDEFWRYLEQKNTLGRALSETEQAQFTRQMDQGSAALSAGKARKDGRGGSTEAALRYCQQAKEYFEAALKINPFDKNTRMLLSIWDN